MKDKNLVAVLTIIFFGIYFIPNVVTRLISVGFILFFAPGFFTLRIHRDINKEELLLISPALSLGISGLIALVLAAFSVLNYMYMLLVVGIYIVITYLLSSSEDIKNLKISRPSKFVSVIIILALVVISVWGYIEFTQTPYKEVDISIEKWNENASLGQNLSFVIYVKNWNYKNTKFMVVFKLNNLTMDIKKFSLSQGSGIYLTFYSKATKKGVNLASFDLYVNGRYYTNVHVYFVVK